VAIQNLGQQQTVSNASGERYNTGDAILDALSDLGVTHIFSNFGSDHPAIIEALAKRKANNKKRFQVITCPHEIVTLCAAHGYAMVSGQGQAVFVHTDVGTANLGGTVHNAARSRIPAFIFAGETPITLEGELPGGRRGPITYLQNVYDQRSIVRPYVKFEYEIRTGANVKQVVSRAMQLAHSDPQGPVYLTAAREVLEQDANPADVMPDRWEPVQKSPLPSESVEQIVNALAEAENPLIVTSYLGRNPDSVGKLVAFCEKLGVPVLEVPKFSMNFPPDHPLHIGYEDTQLVSQADVIVVLDSDLPWEPRAGRRPADDCQVFYIDVDPLKEEIPIWYSYAKLLYRADTGVVLDQFNQYARTLALNEQKIGARKERYKKLHDEQRNQWKEWEKRPEDNRITQAYLSACIREAIPEDAIILNETISNQIHVQRHIPRNEPGTYLHNGGSSLGWSGGAAVGAKLARPDKMVVALSGDGTYMFSVPSTVHYISRRYNAPFLTVIYHNQGWNATKINALNLYPEGSAKQNDQLFVNFDKPSDYAKIAEAAGGAYAETVSKADELPEALRRAVEEVNKGRSAVLNVILPQISNQQD